LTSFNFSHYPSLKSRMSISSHEYIFLHHIFTSVKQSSKLLKISNLRTRILIVCFLLLIQDVLTFSTNKFLLTLIKYRHFFHLAKHQQYGQYSILFYFVVFVFKTHDIKSCFWNDYYCAEGELINCGT
jgi:hypothetical protein